ncbi:50S ribosomal protein L14e [Candidatus Woesearchaeota archaeon]|nr:50S ribosomal protein L14e [Candidatus Woesearchaeota archaeon]
MIEIGRVCVKLAGRDAGKRCVIIDVLDDKTVLIEGETRRRKCNILHLEPLKDLVKVEKNASYEKVCDALGIKVVEKKPKEKTKRPKKVRKKKMQKEAEALEAKVAKKEKKKAEKKEEKKEEKK